MHALGNARNKFTRKVHLAQNKYRQFYFNLGPPRHTAVVATEFKPEKKLLIMMTTQELKLVQESLK